MLLQLRVGRGIKVTIKLILSSALKVFNLPTANKLFVSAVRYSRMYSEFCRGRVKILDLGEYIHYGLWLNKQLEVAIVKAG